jgi:hypothetical protein
MDKTSQFTLANRKQLADMLGDHYGGLRRKAHSALQEKHDSLRRSLTDKFAETSGAAKLAAQIQALKQKLAEQQRALETLGFCLYDDAVLILSSRRDDKLRKSIEAQITKELGTIEDVDERFDKAQIDIMTAATLDDARQIMNSVSGFSKE